MRATKAATSVAVLAIAVTGGLPQSPAAHAAAATTTRYVAPGGSDGSNSCTTKSKPCKTIAHALSVAGAGDTISLAKGTYDEHGLTVATSVSLVGAGPTSSIVDGQQQGGIMSVPAGVSLTLTGVTLQNGHTSDHGGGVVNSGTLTVNHDRFINDYAAAPGGAITNYTTLTSVTNSAFIHDTSNVGGAIVNFDTIGPVTDDLFREDAGGEGAGAIDNQGASIDSIDGSTFIQDTSEVEGGAVINSASIGDISGDTFLRNSSIGGIAGALENVLDGHIGTITNDTFTGNSAVNGISEGGAILNDLSTIDTMADDTITHNTAVIGGGLDNESGTIGSMTGVILSGNTAQEGPNCYFFTGSGGRIADGGYNLLGDADDTCGFSSAKHDLVNTLADLQPVGLYGGIHLVQPPAAGSPVIDAGGPPPCPTAVDEIGTSRPVGPACDIGAVEYVPPTR